MAEPEVRKVYRVLGTSNDVNHCERCGQEDLSITIVLMPLDEDGNDFGDPVYFGSTCGPRAAGMTSREMLSAAKKADQRRREVEMAERQAAQREWINARDAWIAANIGPDALDQPRKYGFTSPPAVVNHYVKTTGVGWS